MLADSEAVIIVRNWIENISKIAFDEISVLSEEVENCDFNRVDINCNFENIKKIIEEDDKIEYKDGSKYIGDIEENKPHGEGQITLSDGRIYCGNFTRGRLEGTVREIDPQDASVREILYHRGVSCGTYRHRRFDDQLLGYGNVLNGVKIGKQLVVGAGGNSFFIGLLDKKEKLSGEVIYLYPCLYTCIVGQYKSGKLMSGHYRTLSSAVVINGFIHLTFSENLGKEVFYDPPSCFSISRYPLQTNQHEDETVYVAMSSVVGAGEGLFARRNIRCGELVSLFSGTKIYKDSNKKSVKYGDDDWSDFRLTLDKSVDLDVGPDDRSCTQYKATLGHKACHSFEMKNSAFHEFEHPRFGRIMSVVAQRNISADEEIFVSYNYSVSMAPEWYQELWFRWCLTRGWSREMITTWIEKEVARWGVPIPLPDFIKNM